MYNYNDTESYLDEGNIERGAAWIAALEKERAEKQILILKAQQEKLLLAKKNSIQLSIFDLPDIKKQANDAEAQ